MRNFVRALAACLVVTACRDLPTSTRDAMRPGASASPSLVPLDKFGIGAGGRGNACRAPEYRQFDFWIGNWNIFNTAGLPSGVSVVTSALGGCAILENFLGGFGRSLSAYDEATGTWNQFFTGPAGGILMLSGTFRRDSMVLEEQRNAFVRDVWVWTRINDHQVRQQGQVFVNGIPLPGGFNGLYMRRPDPPVLPPPPVTVCAREQSRQMDFLLGTWDVYEGKANGAGAPQGTLVVETTAGGCLVEEKITGHAGFEGLAYGAYHPQAALWFRAYTDTDGRYIRMSGRVDGNRMVLTGNRLGANGALVVVRVSWEPTLADRVTQRWEFSLDAGASWVGEREYTFVRR